MALVPALLGFTRTATTDVLSMWPGAALHGLKSGAQLLITWPSG